MESALPISRYTPTSLAALKDSIAVALSLQASGKGSISFCILSFFNEGQREALHKDIYFKGHELQRTKEIRCQVTGFSISDYDYCRVEVLTGSELEPNELFLTYTLGEQTKVS